MDIALPKVGKNYWNAQLIEPAQTGVWTMYRFPRPVVLVPLTPTTIGTYYVQSQAEPVDVSNAIPVPNGNAASLDGVGVWYLRQNSGVSQGFLAIDGGAAGNVSAILASLGLISNIVNVAQIGGVAQSGVDVAGKYALLTPVTPGAGVSVTNASGLKLAARVGRRFLYWHVTNFQGGCNRVTVAFTTPVVDFRGIPMFPDDWRCIQAPGDANIESAVYAITDQGTADIYFAEAL